MTSPNTHRILFLRGAVFLFASGFASIVMAQPGMGPDPYRPFTSQFDAFTFPIAPGRGDVLPNEAALGRAGLAARSNRFQEYLQGNGFGAGNLNYRTQRQLDPQAFRESQYQPNRKVDEESGYYEKQEYVSQAYFKYLRETDPKRRSELLKKYQQARSRPSREFSVLNRRREPRRNEDDPATAQRSERRLPPRAGRFEDDSATDVPTTSRPHSTDRPSGIRPSAPPLRGSGAVGSGRPAAPTPSDTLSESLSRERQLRTSPSPPSSFIPSRRSRSLIRTPPAPRINGTNSSPAPE
jgi:hypothetical protein